MDQQKEHDYTHRLPNDTSMSFGRATALSTLFHIGFPILATLFALVLISVLGWNWLIDKPIVHKDIEFIMVPEQPTTPPTQAKALSDFNQSAGGHQDDLSSFTGEKTMSHTEVETPGHSSEVPPSSSELSQETLATVVPTENTHSNSETPPALASGGEEKNDSNDKTAISAKASDFSPYMAEIRRRLTRNWNPPRGTETRKVVLRFELDRAGELLNADIEKTSGDPRIDEAAIEAVKAATPFKPLPKEYKGESVPVLFTFDYTVYRGSSLKDLFR